MRTALTGFAVLGLLAAGAVPALADTAGTPAGLAISIIGTDGIDSAQLNCDPTDGSTHPTPGRACASLDKVDGDFNALPDTGRLCPYNYDPVTVTVDGTWGAREVHFTHDYPNQCVAEVTSDDVFNLRKNPA
ncbi:SSI family serine proteinase inhibitor [Actinokineospora enzanensis]|uniref:SSI family serine proteinase inhibitor n=1 Tax=Actinokineospora enzanensis TaxID=155975 RepID=UPI000378519E|nr:SSI family serine proteinase inhibitor [Actinokineospora enzanensis]